MSNRQRTSRRSSRAPALQSDHAVYYAVGGVALVLITLILCTSIFRGGRRRAGSTYTGPNPTKDIGGTTPLVRAPWKPARPMTETEWGYAREGQTLLETGRGIFQSAGAPGDAGEQQKLSEARTHLMAAQDKFAAIEGDPPPELEAAMQECNRLMIQVNRRSVLRVGK